MRSGARQSRELVASRSTCRWSSTSDAWRYRGASRERCYDLFSRLGFRTLVMEFAPTARTVEKDYALVRHARRRDARWPSCARRDEFALRVLPDGASAMRASIVGLSFSTATSARSIRAARRCRPRASREASTRAHGPRHLRPVLEDESLGKVGHDLKFDALVLARHGVVLGGLETDTMLASYLARRAPGPRIASRIWRSSTRATRRWRTRTSAAAAQGGVVRADSRRGGGDYARRARRPRASALGPACAADGDGGPRVLYSASSSIR